MNLNPQTADPASEGGPSQRPGMLALPGQFDAGPKRRVPTQTILLALVLAVSGGALYTMRRVGMKSGMTFDVVNVEYQQEDAERAKSYDRIMADLARVQEPLDVALGEFGKSPFMLDVKATAAVAPGVAGDPVAAGDSAADRAAREAEAKRAEVAARLSELRLHSVMDGRVPLARIDDRTVRVGDAVGEHFVVESIQGRSVTLRGGSELFVLSMEQAQAAQPKSSPVKLGKPSKRK